MPWLFLSLDQQLAKLRLHSGGILAVDQAFGAFDGFGEAFTVEWLQQVIDSIHFEGLQCKRVKRCDKNDRWHRVYAYSLDNVESADLGHLYI